MPANRRWIKKNLCSAQRRQARRFRVPLVPADANADPGITGLPGAKSKVSGGKIKLLVKKGVIRNVHLAVFPEIRSVGINDCGGIVVHAGAAPFEEGGHDND